MAASKPAKSAAPNQTPLITVVICSRNRAAQLRHMLESLTRLRVPADLEWELLVVNNGSTDNTDEVVQSFSSRLPVRLTREETPGLSNARNRGVAEARGRYICWTDDDVILEAGWLEAYAAAFHAYPEGVVFGGPISTVLEPPTPRWFARLSAYPPLSTEMAHDFGASPIPLDFSTSVIPWGSNYAVRTTEQRKELYDPRLGVSPVQNRLSEETDSMHRILQGDAQGWWVPDAKVRHVFPPRRQTLSYIFTRSTALGETVSYMKTRPWPYRQAADQRNVGSHRFSVFCGYVRGGLNGALFGLTWVAGAKRQSLDFLTRAGYHIGAARYLAANLRRP
jgi:glycosyltransferase involved in cell wall biosynthesis